MPFREVKDIITRGPDRVMIDPQEAVTPKRARVDYGITPVIVFIRQDGWSLGAPQHLEHAAYRLWKDEWVYYLRYPEILLHSMEEYIEILPEED
jgi:hypothetical protein